MKHHAIAAALLSLVATASQAQFQARDLNGDGSADAYYDPTHNLSWLADANLYATQGGPIENDPSAFFPIPLPAGAVSMSTALSWVDQLVVGAVGDWRLPQRLIPEVFPGSDQCPRVECAQIRGGFPSELGYLSGQIATDNPFGNVQNSFYLSATPGLDWLELRNPVTGLAVNTNETARVWGYIWAVHDGDVGQVAAVPEPSTYVLLAGGLIAMALRARSRRSAEPKV